MYEAVVQKGKIELAESNHVLLTTENRASYSNWELGFLIDVVTRDYFSHFLQELNADVESFFNLIKKRKRRILRELEKLSFMHARA